MWLWTVTALVVCTACATSSSIDTGTDDCMRQLIGLSGMTDAAKTKAVSSFQENGADQSLFYHDHLYANANTLLEIFQIPGVVNRYKLFKCLNKEFQAEVGCEGPCGVHGGLCKFVQDSYRCQCPPGFSGVKCEQELNECDLKRPCLNGATCTDHVNNFTCACTPGFYGRRCETDRNECASSPCVEGSCVDVINGFQCECSTGYAGTVCDEEIDECSSSPCRNGGSCQDHIGKFTCDCLPGFAGPTCKTDVDECASSPCQNKATCQDGVNSYTCKCSLGYDGDHCQNRADDCMRQLIALSGMTDAAKTKAVSSFQENGADQSQFYHNQLYANAKTLLGDLQIPGIINRYKLFMCLNKEFQAEVGCEGPCGVHGGICKLVQDSYRCQCPLGFSGMMCEQELDECELKRPCLNGATCTDHVNNFTCTCAPGFYGRRCETDRNECASSPCVEGSCVDVINGFQCECSAGYAGTVCDEEIDECSSSPCRNGGSCRDHIGKFTCDCSPGFAGPTCKTDVDECASSPCQNKATCQDVVNSYTCKCTLGYDGDHCQNLWLTKTSLDSTRHTVYTRWGRRDCPPNAELIYQGFVGSSYHSHTGSGANSLCMPEEPQYGRYSDTQWRGIIYGSVYEMQNLNKPYSASFTNKRATCAVCMAVNRTSTIMVPARYECPANWHREYHGYIMSTHYQHLKSMYLCFDDELEDAPAFGHIGQQLRPTGGDQPYGLPSTYTTARELTCAVCSK